MEGPWEQWLKLNSVDGQGRTKALLCSGGYSKSKSAKDCLEEDGQKRNSAFCGRKELQTRGSFPRRVYGIGVRVTIGADSIFRSADFVVVDRSTFVVIWSPSTGVDGGQGASGAHSFIPPRKCLALVCPRYGGISRLCSGDLRGARDPRLPARGSARLRRLSRSGGPQSQGHYI